MGSFTSTGRRSRTRAIGAAGTIGRLALGSGMLYLAVTGFGDGAWELQWHEALLGLGVFPAVLLLGQALRLRFLSSATLSATGPVGFCVNFAFGFALFVIARDAFLLFYGASLLFAAVRGYAGCEVLAISNWLLRRDDQVGCVVFSPLDAVEAQVTGKPAAA